MPGETPTDSVADAVAGLVDLPAGPSLAAALACLDLKVLTGSQVVDVLKARYRQNNHDRAQLFAVIAEVLHRGQAETSVLEEYPGEFASDEVRAALVLTRRAADSLCDLAETVVRGLPSVYQAFAAGVIDQPRVRVFRDWTCGLSDEHTAAIVAALLPRAAQLTTAQLMHEIKRYAIALDPTWARRRYERALAGRRVGGSGAAVTRTGRPTWPATTCRSIGSPPPVTGSTGWPRPPSRPVTRIRSTTSAPTCSWA